MHECNGMFYGLFRWLIYPYYPWVIAPALASSTSGTYALGTLLTLSCCYAGCMLLACICTPLTTTLPKYAAASFDALMDAWGTSILSCIFRRHCPSTGLASLA